MENPFDKGGWLEDRIVEAHLPDKKFLESSANLECRYCDGNFGIQVVFNCGIEHLYGNVYRVLKHCHECDSYWWVILNSVGETAVQNAAEKQFEAWMDSHQIGWAPAKHDQRTIKAQHRLKAKMRKEAG